MGIRKTIPTISFIINHHARNVAWCIRKRFPIRMVLCDVWFKDIPKSTIFGHPYGITIRQGVKLGENCTFASNVTIGARRGESECAVVGNHVYFGTGAIILGAVRIGNDAIIGANVTVLRDINEGEVFTGNQQTGAPPAT